MQIPVRPLLAELQWVQRFIEKKTTIPILSHVLFTADGKHLTLTATDLECFGITTLESVGNPQKQWEVGIPVNKLIQYLIKVEDAMVTLKVTGNRVKFSHGSASDLDVIGMSGESFPVPPEMPPIKMSISGLALALKRTLFAITQMESRFSLGGACLELDVEGTGRVIATDGHRLSLAQITAKGVNQKRTVVIPKSALTEVGKLEGDFRFATGTDHVFFEWGERLIIARKMSGNFPDWPRIMPTNLPNCVMIPTQTTLKTLERVAVCADERSHCVKFNISAGQLKISAGFDSNAAGIVKTSKTGEQVTGPLDAGYNANFVIDFLSGADTPYVGFAWKNEKDGALFLSGDGWRYLVMPMRI